MSACRVSTFFSKFVKLPPVDATKVTQIIQYEAQQNVPFPLAEVVWDIRFLGPRPVANWKYYWSPSSPMWLRASFASPPRPSSS